MNNSNIMIIINITDLVNILDINSSDKSIKILKDIMEKSTNRFFIEKEIEDINLIRNMAKSKY